MLPVVQNIIGSVYFENEGCRWLKSILYILLVMAYTQPLDLSAKRPRRTFRAIVIPDMTPMVGVGFLLVSFFLLTATLDKPTVLQVTMPVKERPDDSRYSCFGYGENLMVVLGKTARSIIIQDYMGIPKSPRSIVQT